MNARRFLRSFCLHWRLCALLIAASWVTAAVYCFTARVLFESNAAVLVRYVVERNPADRERPPNREAILRMVTDQLKSTKVANGAVAKLGADTLLEETGAPDALSVVTHGLSVTTKQGTNVLYLSFQHPIGSTAQAALTSVMDSFFQSMLEIHRRNGQTDYDLIEAAGKDRFRGFLINTSSAQLERRGEDITSIPNVAIIQLASPAVPVTKFRDQVTLTFLVAGPVLAALLVTLRHLFGSPARRESATIPETSPLDRS